MSRTLQELTFKDNFLFAATMLESENCKLVLERILEREIERVEINAEKSIIFHPEYRGIRLDVYGKDENNTRYNVEMQVRSQKVERRARYYHSQMDMELIGTGVDYEELPETFVIFICDFDPIGSGKYRYSIKSVIMEEKDRPYRDGVHTILLSTKGRNKDEVPPELVSFLEFVEADLSKSMEDFHDPLVKQLQTSIQRIKANREMGERFMTLEELIKEERKEAKKEGLLEGRIKGRNEAKSEAILILLENNSAVASDLSMDLKCDISSVTDEACLNELLLIAGTAKSIKEIQSIINSYTNQ